MKALVYLGSKEKAAKALQERPKPGVTAPTDAIVKITKTTICGTDLHILKGDVPTCEPGRILGHEGVGVVEEVGAAVTAFKPGDRVLISCISACGKCDYCRKADVLALHDRRLDPRQQDRRHAGRVRPHSLRGHEPLSDSRRRGRRGAGDAERHPADRLRVRRAQRQGRAGQHVAIVGAGPIGLAALLTAQFYSPAEIIMIDLDDNRLEVGQALRRDGDDQQRRRQGRGETVMKMTGGRGVDTAIEAVGIPATFELCEKIVAPGGTIANIGVHGTKVDLHLESLWDRNITITTRLVDTVSTPMLLKTVGSHKIDPKLLITHRFKLDQILDAYETFGHAAKTKALKVIIEA